MFLKGELLLLVDLFKVESFEISSYKFHNLTNPRAICYVEVTVKLSKQLSESITRQAQVEEIKDNNTNQLESKLEIIAKTALYKYTTTQFVPLNTNKVEINNACDSPIYMLKVPTLLLLTTNQPLKKKEKGKLKPLRVINVKVLIKEYAATSLAATIKIPISDLAQLCPSILNAQLAYLYNIRNKVNEAIVIKESKGLLQ